ncbi:MAG: hypothetical protein WA584_04855 [Pyrinomonadaceae bacterium]
MITGFNTDIEYQGVTYHVQTEDKGVATPLILSLVYDRGTILASKRSPYDDLLVEGFDEKVLTERLQKQHKLICAAVRSGRIEDLKRMTMKESALKQKGLIAQKEIKPAAEKKEIVLPQTQQKTEEIPSPQFLAEKIPPVEKSLNGNSTVETTALATEEKIEARIPKPAEDLVLDIPINVVEETIIEEVQIVEEEVILPAEAVEIVTDFAKAEPADDKLKIELLNDAVFRGGARKTISILVKRSSSSEEGLSGAHVLVKVIGSSFRPLIFHARTDINGIAVVHLQLPHFKSGRAAVLVKAMSEGEEAEIRRIILQG